MDTKSDCSRFFASTGGFLNSKCCKVSHFLIDCGTRGCRVEVCSFPNVDELLRRREDSARPPEHSPLPQKYVEAGALYQDCLCEGSAGVGTETEEDEVEFEDERVGEKVPGCSHKSHSKVTKLVTKL